MDVRAIRQLADEAILNEIEDQKESIYKLRFQKAAGQLEDVTSIRKAQRIIARLKTVLHERTLAAQKGTQNA